MPVNVFIVEDHEIVRQGIRALLEGNEDIVVTGEAVNGADAIEKLRHVKPDVILMDMNMPVMNGLECTRLIRKHFPSIKILTLSMHDHESYLSDMLEAGASGYILKNSSMEELIYAVKKVASDGIYIGPEFAINLLAKYRHENRPEMRHAKITLTEKELEVLDLVADGLTNVEIANRLFTSVRTIETRRKKLLDKTGTTNTATLIRYSVRNGLIK